MSITTYSELKTAIANWLARDTLTSYIPDFIVFGENRIYRDLRLRCMETALSSTISSGVIAVPSGYLELKHAYIDGSPTTPLERKNDRWVYEYYQTRSADGKPKWIAREGDNFIFAPYPDSDYTVKGIYYKRLDALSDSNTTNWFTANAADLLLSASLAEAWFFLKNDANAQLWEMKYEKIKKALQDQDKIEQYSGSPLTINYSLYA